MSNFFEDYAATDDSYIARFRRALGGVAVSNAENAPVQAFENPTRENDVSASNATDTENDQRQSAPRHVSDDDYTRNENTDLGRAASNVETPDVSPALSLDRLKPATRAAGDAPISGLSGQRVSVENPDQYFSGLQAFAVFSGRNNFKDFLAQDNLNLSDFKKIRLDQLSELLADLSPEVSDALWKFLLMCNAGYEITALKKGTDEPDENAQAALNEMTGKLARHNGSLDVFFNRQFMTVALRGSTLAELVLDLDGRTFADIATPDTRTLKYKRRLDPVRGQVWDFGQTQNGEFVSLDIETVRYAPLHPFPNSIEGRPLLASSFFLAIFLMSVLRDFKRVIQQQGYPRLDVEVDFEKIRDSMPPEAHGNPEAFEKWVNGIVNQVVGVYKKLKPDDTYVHTTVTKVNAPIGAINSTSLGAMDGLFKALERMAARALHTMPLLLGITDGVSEANANRQWEIYAKGCESVQHLVENTNAPLFELALEAQGILCDVEIRFAQMRAAEKLRDAQVEFLEAKIAQFQRDQGWISQDAAAQKGAGVKQAFAEEPLYAAALDAAGVGGNENNIAALGTGGAADRTAAEVAATLQLLDVPENERGGVISALGAMHRAPSVLQLAATAELWKKYAPEPAQDLIGAETVSTQEN